MKKAIIGAVSVIVLVAVVIAVVASKSSHGSNDGGNSGISTTQKAIEAICSPTDYRETCEKSLNNVASTNPKDLMAGAFKATEDQIRSAFHVATNISTDNSMQRLALDDCKTLLQDAIDELQEAISEVGSSELNTLQDRVDNLKNWLSAVISYQHTCMDGLTQPELKSTMQNGLGDAGQLTSNALAIVSGLSSIFSSFKLPFNLTAPSRQLLEHDDVAMTDAEGYPSWFSAGDRRLLAAQRRGNLKPHAVVAQDGSGNFKTINDALNAMQEEYSGRYVIYVKAGIYKEQVLVDKKKVNVFMYGDGPRKTVVTGSKNYLDGTTTYQTATFATIGNGFIGKSMGFSNTAGSVKEQAVALRVQSDMSAFFNCRMDAFQDTLYAQTHRQFYRNCVISGTIDFIFGDGAVVLQNCLIIARRPLDGQKNIVTAQGRTDKRETTGIVIQNCRIVPDKRLFPVRFQIPTYLGRPWKEYSKTIIMESTLSDFIQPAGWLEWKGDFALNTLFYGEYANRGPGAGTSKRVRWPGVKVLSKNEALQYTAEYFIQGRLWLKYTGTPHFLGFKQQ